MARRRAVVEDERGASAERTRERILQAAVEEFGAKGYSGARTAGIATRAGVNQQLISYHFGGKQGLLDELRRRWAEREAALVPPDASFAESFSTYLDATLDQPDWSRLVIWQALGDGEGMTATQRAGLRQAVEGMRRRQEGGELTGDLDPGFVLLLAYVLTFAPISLPEHVREILGVDPLSEEYRAQVRDQLMKVLRAE
ncbi:TetR/AcrR family transcriptional regulator [Streptosporangium sp. CA-135522]|uniref:TetR/AcrR family transcriptional regulator n=1 Tax=Streptosporangium sp. CA-135522 TaxID=3240072 RepID=UPI003D8FD78F